MKKTMCLITIVFIALFFSGCASMQGFMDKILVCEEAPVPVDSDGDGVFDCKDKCPNTPKGVAVCPTGCPLDSDGDGVVDSKDKCPDTPKGVAVNSKGCPKDTDGDGVYDYQDKCPGTPKGAKVNNIGCRTLAGVNFDTDKSVIKPGFAVKLNKVADVLKKNPGLKIEIQGHTDNVGNAAYNLKLSERRATAVNEYLVNQGIVAEKMTAKGFGLTAPAATNDTEEGRAQNRRVELTPIK